VYTDDPDVIKKYLTSRQREVVDLLGMGYDRKEVAKALMPPVCVQAVHQIILRIRKRLLFKANIQVRGYEARPNNHV
jgi:DNA-binding NarL/FixJ family response regulator